MKSIIYKISILYFFLSISSFAVASDVYIIANKSVPIEKITMDDLSNVFLGKKQFWNTKIKIDVAYISSSKSDKEKFFKSHIKTPYKKFKRYWFKRVFSGYGSAPKMFKRSNKLVLFVQENMGAIAYLNKLPDDLTNLKVINVVE